MNQVEDRLSVLDDKVEELDQTNKEYEKEQKKSLKATFRKFGTPQKTKSLNYRHRRETVPDL